MVPIFSTRFRGILRWLSSSCHVAHGDFISIGHDVIVELKVRHARGLTMKNFQPQKKKDAKKK